MIRTRYTAVGTEEEGDEYNMMRLYRMELYKLCCKKTFLICGLAAVLLTMLVFWINMDSEETVVKGKRYHGYEAVRIDRQTTREYEGVFTDEKAASIVEQYGLPSKMEYDHPGWRDGNYLNSFVTDYLTDGDGSSWDHYTAPTRVYAIADTKLGELRNLTGEELCLAYTKGWRVFLDTLQLGMIHASVVIITGLSVVFAQEGQTGMLPLIFTARNGKEKDGGAKIAAAFTLTIIVYLITALLSFLLSVSVYGLDGKDIPLCIALSQEFFFHPQISLSYVPVAEFAWMVLGWDLLALMLLCAIVLCVSAHYKSTFGAVTMAAVLWGMPILISMFGGILYFVSSCMPVFLIMTLCIYEVLSWGWGGIMLMLIIPMFVICVEEGYRVYVRSL